MSENIRWNNKVKFIISDVDETAADLYVKAEPEMVTEISKLLEEKKAIMFITGQGIKNVQWRIINDIPEQLRQRILVGQCSGVEVWGFNLDGSVKDKPFYSVYDSELNDGQKAVWREIIKQIIVEFKLKVSQTMPIPQFLEQSGGDPLHIMMEDRGPQITFEVVNGVDLTPDQIEKLELSIPETHGSYDIRIPIVERADQLFADAGLPITSRLAGNFAIDFAVKGVSKTTAIEYVLDNEAVLASVGLGKEDVKDQAHLRSGVINSQPSGVGLIAI
jgi:hydroxymethylpyrimidine pyrophosphatase-like HAD family hydrolase